MEIEIRAFIENIEKFRKKLDSIESKFIKKVHIIDNWFCEKSKNNFDEVKQDKVGSYGLRIRQIDDKTELNCKVLKNEEDHNIFHEFETKVNDFDQTKKILESIGFKVFCVLDKKRYIYKFENCLINIEDIKNFEPTIELEIIADENEEEYKKYLIDLMEKLDIKEKQIIDKSITYLFMKKFAFKQ